MSALLVPVMDRYAKAWPRHGDKADVAEPFTFERAFSERFDDDPHFTAYAPVDDHRLDMGAIGRVPITMQLFVVDVEPANHAPRTPEWDADQQPRIERAISDGAFFYSTRGGYRLVWTIAPFAIATPHDAERWKASYLAALDDVRERYGIDGDRNCKDWTRLYRLPFVTRDGSEQQPEVSDLRAIQRWPLRVVEPTVTPTTTVAPVNLDDEINPELIDHVRKQLRDHGPAIAHAEHPPDGHGGDEHTYRACAIVRDYDLPDEQACALLDEWNQTCVPPWDRDELRTKMDNAYNYGSGERGAKRAEWEQLKRMRERWGSRATNATSTPSTEVIPLDEFADEPEPEPEPGTDAAEYAQALCDVQSYWRTQTEERKPSEFKRSFKNARESFEIETTPPRFLIKRLLVDGGTAMISGEPKSAKTWLAIECSIAIATGTYAIDPKYTATKGNVAYFFTEDLDDAIKTRVRALLQGRGLTPDAVSDRLFWEPRGDRIDITRDDDCARIIASARLIERDHGKLVLLSIDPLRNIHNADEDKSGDMMTVFERLKMIEKLLDCTALLVHHAKKATTGGSKRGGQKMRGSSAMHGFLDSGIFLDDVRVNDEGNEFTNNVESELKAVRSAGKFKLTLTVEDDPFTESARSATWSTDGKSADTATTNTDDEQLLADVRELIDVVRKLGERGKNPPHKSGLRDLVADMIPDHRCRAAIGYPTRKGYLDSGPQPDRETHVGSKLPGDRITVGKVPVPEPTSKREPTTKRKPKGRAIKTTEIK